MATPHAPTPSPTVQVKASDKPLDQYSHDYTKLLVFRSKHFWQYRYFSKIPRPIQFTVSYHLIYFIYLLLSVIIYELLLLQKKFAMDIEIYFRISILMAVSTRIKKNVSQIRMGFLRALIGISQSLLLILHPSTHVQLQCCISVAKHDVYDL